MSDREQSPPMDVACEVDDRVERRSADGEQETPNGGKQQPTADGGQEAPDGDKQQVNGGQKIELDDGEEQEYDDDEEDDESNGEEEDESNGEEEDESNGEEEDESNGGDEESIAEVNESDREVDESAGLQNVGQDNPANEPPRGQYDYVYLRLISDIHPDEGFLVKTTEPMRNMKRLHHSQLNETQKQSLKQYFLYNGNLISDEDTPQSLGLKETDDIHVFHTMGEAIRVHTVETGEVRQLQL